MTEPEVEQGSARSDPDAEAALLGAILIDERCFELVQGIVGQQDFYVPQNATLFAAFKRVRASGRPIEVVTLVAELKAMRRYRAVGGAQYIRRLVETSSSTAHAVTWATRVVAQASTRRLMQVGRDIVARGEDAAMRDEDIASMALAAVTAHAVPRGDATAMTHINDVLIQAWEEIEISASGGAAPSSGTSTGYRALDAVLGGYRGGELIVIAARPAMGKTSLVLQAVAYCSAAACALAKAAGEAPGAWGVFSLEMPKLELIRRMLSCESRVPADTFRTGLFTQEYLTALAGAASGLSMLPVFIDDSSQMTPGEMRSKLERLRRDHGRVRGVFIDYLQLMRADARGQSREQELSEITRFLKGIAKEFDCYVVALSQLNRDCEKRPNKRPQLPDLRESGAIEQDTDVVMFIYRDDYYDRDSEDRGIAELIVAKQRHGATATARVRWISSITRFEDLAAEQQAEFVVDAPADSDFGSGEATYP